MPRLNRITFALKPVSPFRLDLTAWALRRRPHNVVDRWDGRAYRRVLALNGAPVAVTVEQIEPPSAPRLRVTVTGTRLAPDARSGVRQALRRLLGVEADLADFYRFARRDTRLRVLAHQFRGFKPPRFLSVFESLVNAFACQQVSLTVGIELLNRLTEAHGATAEHETAHAFPLPEALAGLGPDGLRWLGFSRQKSRAIVELARGVASRGLDLERIAGLDDEEAVACLSELRGVGRWTAEYVLLRGLGRLHIFPGDDVGARNRLRQWLGKRALLDYGSVHRALAPWSRFGGLIYFHLLLKGLAEAGLTEPTATAGPPGV